MAEEIIRESRPESTQEELDKQTSMINRGETEPVVTEQSSPVKSSDKVAASPDVKKDVEEKKQKDIKLRSSKSTTVPRNKKTQSVSVKL